MIPKILHYCWISEHIPENISKYIQSWNHFMPDYQIIKWDLSNFDIAKSDWVREAVEKKKWAFAADYIRLYAVYNFGGIYLDSDVEVLKPFDDLLDMPYFLGTEKPLISPLWPEPAIFGAEPKCVWVKDCLDYYEGKKFVNNNKLSTTALNFIVHNILEKKYGLKQIQNKNEFDDNCKEIQLLPDDYFSPKSGRTKKIYITKNTYCIHHFNNSWITPFMFFKNRISRIIGLKNYNKIKKIFKLGTEA
ncbi:MAG: hypothetical protein FWF63_00925 [Fibromonadales bacterium]|nr:hypothetical protein [Fibromonadales bacterium]